MSSFSCDRSEMSALALRGDLAALDALTRCQGQRLLSVGRRYCRSEEEARDAVQDAMVNAADHLGDFEGSGPLEGWVLKMVARACGRMRRGRKNDPGLHAVELDLASADDSPEVLAGRARMAAALGEALLEVPALDRAVLLLAEAEDLTGPEIAAELGLSAEAVRARLSRVRRKVRARMEALVPEAGP